MKEYQFRVEAIVYVDVHADNADDAVEELNARLNLLVLDGGFVTPGRLESVSLNVRRLATTGDIVAVYEFDEDDPLGELHRIS